MKYTLFGMSIGFIIGFNINNIWYNTLKRNILIPIDKLNKNSTIGNYIDTFNRGIIKTIKEANNN